MARKKRRKDGPEGLGGEVLRNAKGGASIEQQWHIVGDGKPPKKPSPSTNMSMNSSASS